MTIDLSHLSDEARVKILTSPRGTMKPLAEELGIAYNSLRAWKSVNSRAHPLADAIIDPNGDDSGIIDLDDLDNPDRISIDAELAIASADDRWGIPEALNVIPSTPLWIPFGDVLVMSDLHFPHHSAVMLRRALTVTTMMFPQVRAVTFVGDVFNFGRMSRHPRNSHEASFADEKKIAGTTLRAILSLFDDAYFCLGNHDERMARKWEEADDLDFMISGVLGANRPKCQVHCSDYDYLLVDNDNPALRWKLVHPMAFSQQGAKTPQDIADLEHINVAAGHNHRAGMTTTRDGQWTAVDLGHMTDPNLHWYAKRRATRFAKWAGGFMVLSNGTPHVFWDTPQTDWSKYGCS